MLIILLRIFWQLCYITRVYVSATYWKPWAYSRFQALTPQRQHIDHHI